MFKLFKNKATVINPVQEKMAGLIVKKGIQFQMKWAGLMQRITERFSLQTKKIGLLTATITTCLYSLFIIAQSIVSKPKQSIPVSKIQMPQHIISNGDIRHPEYSLIPEKEYRKIIRFHQYMDSLGKTTNGRKIADSILKNRPGLLDSTLELKKLYELQQTVKK